MTPKDIKFWKKAGVSNPHECKNCKTVYNIAEQAFNGGSIHSCPMCQRITRLRAKG